MKKKEEEEEENYMAYLKVVKFLLKNKAAKKGGECLSGGSFGARGQISG